MGKMTEDDKGGGGIILGQVLADVICERSLTTHRTSSSGCPAASLIERRAEA